MGPGQATCLGIIILTGVGLFCTSAGLFWFTGGDVPSDYGITIDAGSSKTAFYLYDWSAAKLNETGLVRQLDKELVLGGIDDNGEDTKELIKKLSHALSRITRKIDYTSKNYKIPIYLGATAGMRILRIQNSLATDKILRDIKQTFDAFTDSVNDFKVQNVEIISGTKEGLYCWIATNYLMNYIPEELEKSNGTVGTLDMGGASVQIAFQVGKAIFVNEKSKDNSIKSEANGAATTMSGDHSTSGANDVSDGESLGDDNEDDDASGHVAKEKTTLFGRTYQISTFSNLCYGNDDAVKRYKMLLILEKPESSIIEDPCTHPEQLVRDIDVEALTADICTYDHNGERRTLPLSNYTFVAKPDLVRCGRFTRQLVRIENIRQNFKDYDFKVLERPPPKNMRFFAMSTFYFAAKQLRNREIVTFQDEDEMAIAINTYCGRNWYDVVTARNAKEIMYIQNFCFSVNYVFSFLKHVYRFKGKQFSQIEFRGQLGGHSLGWALGYMLQATNRIPGSGPKPSIIGPLWFSILVIFSAALLLFAAGSVVKQHISNKGEYMASQDAPENKQQSQV